MVTASDILPGTTFHVTCNSFKVENAPPGDERFYMIKARNCVEDAPEEEVPENQGDREATTVNIFSSLGFLDVAYASGRTRP